MKQLFSCTLLILLSFQVCLAQKKSKVSNEAEKIVQKQLDAYNNRDIDAFMDTYADSIQLFSFPDQLFMNNKDQMRASYKSMFEQNPDLHCKLLNRIVIGNKVIDREEVKTSRNTLNTVAVYEVKGGKIVKVTFINP